MKVVKILKIFIISIFALLTFVAIAVNVKLPQGYKVLAVQSGSMEPTIPVGSVIITKPSSDFTFPLPTHKFLKGDVIAFSTGKIIVSHRVIETVKQDGQFFYKTKGDANEEADQDLVAEKNVVGKVKLTIPYIGLIVNFAKQPLGYFLMILIPSLYVILSEVWAIVQELRKSKTKIRANGISVPIVLLFVSGVYVIGGTFAFLNDKEAASGNTFQSAEAFCDEGPTWLSQVVANNQGTRKDGSVILPSRTNPSAVLGAANWTVGGSTGFFSLGFIGGSATWAFPYQILNISASLTFYEATNGRSNYPLETAFVFVSKDNVNFVFLGQISSEPSGDGITTLSLSSVGLSSIKYVRLVETSNPAIHTNDADGLDIDAISAEFGDCD